MPSENLEVRLLGELEVWRDGRRLALPASKKSRALLGYLVATARPQLRQALCELLWEGPDDPRAGLRWSLAKLRPLVDGAEARLVSTREHVAFEARGAGVDLARVREALLPGAAAVPTDALRQAAALFRGELLEGLELPDCYRYHQWCLAEREAARALRLAVLAALVDRLRDDPEAALAFARARVAVEPLSEAAHAAVVRLLGQLGRTREAQKQYEQCCRLLESELGTRPSAELEEARRGLGRGLVPAPPPPPADPAAPPAPPPLVGRQRERELLESVVREAVAGSSRRVLLMMGEPGIGKSRLLDELGERVRGAGGRVLTGRAFEAEMVRPYGAWIDALRSDTLGEALEPLRADLAPLLPELGGAHAAAADRNRLFDAVTRLLAGLAAAGGPLAVLLDDLHWCDEATVALLHFAARGLAGSRVLLAGAARPGELADNPACLRLVRALVREGRLQALELAPLDAAEIEQLARGVAPGVDAVRIAGECEGNPLFALELARALHRGEPGPPETLAGLIEERLGRLDDRARELLPWAAALGRSFDVETLGTVAGLAPAELLAAIQDLEQRGIVRAAQGGRGYDFVHDLVRRGAYQQLSEPRRRLVHRHVAQALESVADPDGALAAEVAHHAALGGDAERSARAAVVAGERCLRVFAYAEAAELALRGLRLLPELPQETRLKLQIGLLRIYIHSGAGRDKVGELEAELSRVVLEAREAGLYALVQAGFYLSSFLHYHQGDFALAHEATLRAAEAGRSADPATAAGALANTARCLALLQRDLPRAEALLHEAQLRAAEVRLEILDVHWGLGLVRHHAAEHRAAVAELERAVLIARRQGDHWSECDCLSRLALIAFEDGHPQQTLERCRELAPVAAKMGEGSERPFAAALEALARLALAEPQAEAALEAALAALREVDSHWMLACISNRAAEIDLAAGRIETAERRAREALTAADSVSRRSEVVLAGVMLAEVALARGDRPAAIGQIQALRSDLASPGSLSGRAAAAVSRITTALGVPIPTVVPTLATTPRP